MLKANFAERAIEISAVSTAIPIAVFSQDNHEPESRLEAFDGNAFNGSQANRQFAELQIQQNALGGGHTGDPLINVRGKLLGQFDIASGKKKDDRTKDMMMSILLEQQIKRFNQFLSEEIVRAKENLNESEEALENFRNGLFDPLNRNEDRAYIESRGLSEDEWAAMPLAAQEKWIEDNIARERQEILDLEQTAKKLAQNPEMLKAKLSTNQEELTQEQMKEALAELRAEQRENRSALIELEARNTADSNVSQPSNPFAAGFS